MDVSCDDGLTKLYVAYLTNYYYFNLSRRNNEVSIFATSPEKFLYKARQPRERVKEKTTFFFPYYSFNLTEKKKHTHNARKSPPRMDVLPVASRVSLLLPCCHQHNPVASSRPSAADRASNRASNRCLPVRAACWLPRCGG